MAKRTPTPVESADLPQGGHRAVIEASSRVAERASNRGDAWTAGYATAQAEYHRELLREARNA